MAKNRRKFSNRKYLKYKEEVSEQKQTLQDRLLDKLAEFIVFVMEITKPYKTIILYSFLVISFLGVAVFCVVDILKPTPEKIWEKAQLTQRDNSFTIEAAKIETYIRSNGKTDTYQTKVRFYKDGTKWRSERDDETTTQKSDKSIVTLSDRFIAIYDGKALHDYVEVEDEYNTGEFQPTELTINKGEIIYEQEKKEGREQPLEEIIADFNSMNVVINWYKPTFWEGRKEQPKIIGKDTINGYSCTKIRFSEVREVCVSEDYGIAISWKYYDRSKYDSVNKEIVSEYRVSKVKNSELDNIRISKSKFMLPDIEPWHVYGEY